MSTRADLRKRHEQGVLAKLHEYDLTLWSSDEAIKHALARTVSPDFCWEVVEEMRRTAQPRQYELGLR